MTRGTQQHSPVTEPLVIRETILSAVIAGLIAALALTALQITWVTPLILKAETFESPVEHTAEHKHSHDVQEWHEAQEWTPQDGWQRTAFTFGANMLMGFGYAFLLTAVYLLWRQPSNALWGALYGLAGFITFFAAPALGLPPELPGTAAAPVVVRQLWWVMIAATTGAGLLLAFSRMPIAARLLGVALIVAPHFVSAPQPDAHASLAPAELQSQFRIASTLSNAVFWVLLGIASSFTHAHFHEHQSH